MVEYTEHNVSLENLLLDPNNFRFNEPGSKKAVPESRFAEKSVQDAIRVKIERDGVHELKNSIAENGFVPVERIVVRPWGEDKDKFVVVEGNRRTAALKLLLEDFRSGVEIRPDLVEIFEAVPVLVVTNASSSDYMSIMGIRHVGGPKAWGGYQSAELVATLLDADANTTPVDVANRLGLTVREVNRRYRAYGALQQMMEDEEVGDRVTKEMYPIFHEVVAQPDIRQWLEWDDRTRTFTSTDNRALFYGWLVPGEEGEAKITRHSDVRDLRAILSNPDALGVLKDPLSTLGEAVGVVVADARASEWVHKVEGAFDALNSIGAETVEKLDGQQLGLLKELERSITRAIAMHNALKVDG